MRRPEKFIVNVEKECRLMEYRQPYQEKYPHLFAPITVRGKQIKNRIIMAPHGRTHAIMDFGGDGATLSMEGVEYYSSFARGGAGIVNITEVTVDKERGAGHGTFNIFNDATLPTLNMYSDFTHSYGALASMELSHCGQYALPQLTGHNPIGPTARISPNGNQVEEMTEEDMDRVADYFARAANMARRGGFDCILLHAGHSWLLSQFLSPIENQRKDKYGGSLENRARFPIMVIDRIREKIGDSMLIELRISTSELSDGGFTPDEAVEFVKMVDGKIDLVQCSVGSRRNAFTRGIMHPSHFMANGCNAYLAERLKKGGVKSLVTAIGAINEPELAERILAEGKADFVAMMRSFLADPEWAEKVRAGREEDIRPCIKCLRCLDVAGGRVHGSTKKVLDDFENATRHAECSVNPTSNREHAMFRYPAPKRSRKFVVIGGGPAGMQAAIRASDRGHEVTLIEKDGRLGGQLFYSDHIVFKRDIRRFRDYLVTQVEKRAIKVMLNTAATPDLVHKLAPDAVIVAIGAEPIIPKIPGVSGENVYTALDIFGHEDKLGNTVAVVGGGGVGVETALHLAQLGKHVHLIEMTDTLMADGVFTERMHTLYYLDHEYVPETAQYNNAKEMPDKVHVLLETKCTAIEKKAIVVKSKGKDEEKIPVDSVVISVGMIPRTEEADSFCGVAYDVVKVGDAKKAGTIYNATTTAFDAATVL